MTIELTAVDSSLNINLALRLDQKSTIESGTFIADVKSQTPEGIERLQLDGNSDPPLKAGTHYITIGNLEATTVDFTLLATISRQEDQFPPWDVNQDGITNILDLVAVAQQFGRSTLTNPRADVNKDGVVDVVDIVLVSSHFGQESSTSSAPTLRQRGQFPASLLGGRAGAAHSTAVARVWLEPISFLSPLRKEASGLKHVLHASLKADTTGGEIYGGQFNLAVSAEQQSQWTAHTEIMDIQRGARMGSSQQVYWHSSRNGVAFTHLGNTRGIGSAAELAIITLQTEDLKDTTLSLRSIRLVDANGKLIPVAVKIRSLSGEAMHIPEKSALLPNYPNPFNPETWMPYQLAQPAHVLISIYDARGMLIRQLDLGHRAAASYISRHRAAYWDGRNRYGEKVASDVYFYRIEAGDFHAIRKMAVVK